LNVSINDYFVSAIPMCNSIVRKPMWKPKFHKNLPKREIFQIKVELSAGLYLWFPKCFIIITIIHSGIRQT